MTIPHNENQLGQPLRNKKKRGAVFIVIVASVVVHVLGLGIFGVIKIVETISEPPEFEAPPVEAIKPPPPPPPPPPTTKRSQRSLPRPQPLAVQNPKNMSVPSIDMQESDLSLGAGRGFGGGLGEIGGGALDSLRLTSFGFDQALEGTLEGYLYDLKQNPKGKPSDLMKSIKTGKDGLADMKSRNEVASVIRKFTSSSWSTNKWDREYYRVDKPLYASYFIIPAQRAEGAPKAFNAHNKVKPRQIAVLYKGTYTPPADGRFRFYGLGDDTLIVRLNKRIVLDATIQTGRRYTSKPPPKEDDLGKAYFDFNERFKGIYGDWFNLKQGQPVDMEVLLVENPGGLFGAWLTIQEKGGQPKIFSGRPLSREDRDFIRKTHRDSAQFLD